VKITIEVIAPATTVLFPIGDAVRKATPPDAKVTIRTEPAWPDDMVEVVGSAYGVTLRGRVPRRLLAGTTPDRFLVSMKRAPADPRPGPADESATASEEAQE
jgi:hypothetical protein